MSSNETILEYNRLRKAWADWNRKCQPEDTISWVEYLEENS